MSRQNPAAGRFVELIGPAGAGKTSLMFALMERHGAQACEPKRATPHYFAALMHDVPMWIGNSILRFTPPPSWTELRAMAYMRLWHQEVLSRRSSGLQLLDHGPIFRLVTFDRFGTAFSRTASFERWAAARTLEWRTALDAIVWLDAPDDVLHDRIQTRAQEHELKGASRARSGEYLRSYRSAFREILDRVTGPGAATLIEASTALDSTEAIADRVAAALIALPETPLPGNG